jgi:GTP-binding protein
MASKQLPAVVLVGRPNVGKSTLFNRVAGTRRAIVNPTAGTTRDVIQQPASWRNVPFVLTDTAGMFGQSEDPLQKLVLEHGRRALQYASVFVFVVDGREGLVPADLEIAEAVRTKGKPVIVAINKADDKRARSGALDFYELGFEPVMEISAEHGQGIGDLLDEVITRLPEAKSEELKAEEPEPRIAIVGRPNVGKSSLVNRILREERMLVSEVAGTTRDAVDTNFRWHQRQFRIVDTAGIRKPGRVARSGAVESVSVLSAKRAIADADVVVLVIDATLGAADQDGAIAGEAERAGRSVIIAVNKWDLMKGEGQDFSKVFDDKLRFNLKFLDFAPIVHISALTGERTPKLLEVVEKVLEERTRRIPTPVLNRFFQDATAGHPIPSEGKKAVRILYAAQVGVAPPTFALFMNVATDLHFSYERFLKNRMREEFGFLGTPIRLQVRRRKRSRDS